MRLAIKTTLLLLPLSLLTVAGIGWWMLREVDELGRAMISGTARLVGNEVASALTDSALQRLRSQDAAARRQLASLVDQVTEHSSILTSLAVVDRSGRVVAGDNVDLGRLLAAPATLFTGAGGAPLVQPGDAQDRFYVMVPLREGDQLAGYIRLGMRIERLTQVYARATRNLLLIGLAALLAVGLVGALLHTQLSRRSRLLARDLAHAARGRPLPPRRRDEFAHAIDVAREVGRELGEARGGRAQALGSLDALLRALDVGVLIVEPDVGLGFANQRAVELLGHADVGALSAAWDATLRPILEPMLRAVPGAPAARRHEHELPASGRAPRARLECYAMGDGSCPHVILVRGAASLDALQAELGLAIQMRGLTRFYVAFAHDLKAPLNAMMLTLELVRLSLQSGSPADAEKRLQWIATLKQEIGRLDRQLRSLLVHTALPRDERGVVELRALLELLVQLVTPQARQQQVTIDARLPPAAVLVEGNADRLKQALLNILINALEAMPEGGTLSIALGADGDVARVAIGDTGPGIPPELLDDIYQMHFTTKDGGTGVGLYVARSVVQAHGGSIDVRSDDGRGTAFAVALPLAAGAPLSPPA